MSTKSSVRLDQVIVHDPHGSKIAVFVIVVFRKGKVKSGFQPILIGPGGITAFVGSIAKPLWIGFGNVQLVVGDKLDGRSHGVASS